MKIFLVAQNHWFSVLLIVKNAASQDVQYALGVREVKILATSDPSVD